MNHPAEQETPRRGLYGKGASALARALRDELSSMKSATEIRLAQYECEVPTDVALPGEEPGASESEMYYHGRWRALDRALDILERLETHYRDGPTCPIPGCNGAVDETDGMLACARCDWEAHS